MKTYNVVFNNKKNKGVFGISLVENPAMEGNFIALSKDDNRIKLQSINEERRELIGLVLEPNKPIYRVNDKEEFNIVFSAETIKDLAHNFAKQGYQNNSTLEHQDELKLSDVTFAESWIVEDPNKDKSNAFGLSYPKGSWLATMKVDDDVVWDGLVKNGFVKGFSIDAFIDLEEINLKSEIEMSEVKEEVKTSLSEFKDWAVSFFKDKKEEVKTELEETKEEVKEEVKEEIETKTETKEEVKEEVKEELSKDEVLDALKNILTEFKKDVDTKLSAKDVEIKGLESKLVEMGKQTVSKPVKSAPKQAESLNEFLNNNL